MTMYQESYGFKRRLCCFHIRTCAFLVGSLQIVLIFYFIVLTVYVAFFRTSGSSVVNSSDVLTPIDEDNRSTLVPSSSGLRLRDIPSEFVLRHPIASLIFLAAGSLVGLTAIGLLFYGLSTNRPRALLAYLVVQLGAMIVFAIALIVMTVEAFALKDRLIDAAGGRWNGGPHMEVLTVYFVYIDSFVVGILLGLFATFVGYLAYRHLEEERGKAIDEKAIGTGSCPI